MSTYFEYFIGLRYVCSKHRNHFISFISMISILGVGLGVAALIVILSVMNGFETELKNRILSMASHAVVISFGEEFTEWREVLSQAESHPEVLGVAPFYRAEAMLVHGAQVRGTIIRAVLPKFEGQVSEISKTMVKGEFNALVEGGFNIILGIDLASFLGVGLGDKVMVVSPQVGGGPAGLLPRFKRFRVVGLFKAGMYEYDSALALIHLGDSYKLYRRDTPSGIRIKTADILQAPAVRRSLQSELADNYRVIDWTERHANFFRALQTEKTVMFIILLLIVTVAAFNIVSSLMMVVRDKTGDIAVLRTLGATPGSILLIFILQGLVIGLVGVLFGLGLGIVLALNIETLIVQVEALLDRQFLAPEIYYISELPSDLRFADVATVGMVAFCLCLLATIYPAWQASRVQPAEALRYE